MGKKLNTFLFLILAAVIGVSTAYAGPLNTEGYDENTELTLKVILADIVEPARGPVVLDVRVDGKSYKVVTAPRWYLARQGITFIKNSELEITGSKSFGWDSVLYIFAREIRDVSTGRTILFRDRTCRPMWMMERGLLPPSHQGQTPMGRRFWPPWR
jgi:hypothetical protein